MTSTTTDGKTRNRSSLELPVKMDFATASVSAA